VYTFWIQQTSANPATYEHNIFLVPAPGSAGLLVAAGFLGLRRRRH
jgi:hypothetical protein